MNRDEKAAVISDVRQKFEQMTSAVFVNYESMNVESLTKLRDEFRKTGVQYRVVKNTLVRQAVKGMSFAPLLDKTLTGMTGIAWSFEDPSTAAKVLVAFKKVHEKLKIKAGLIEGQILSANAVENQLATMPGKDELRAQLLATMQAPLQEFVRLLNAPAQNLVYALDAKRRKDEAGSLTYNIAVSKQQEMTLWRNCHKSRLSIICHSCR